MYLKRTETQFQNYIHRMPTNLAVGYNEMLAAASISATINVFALIPMLAAALVLNLTTPVDTFNQQLHETTKVSITSPIIK